MSKQNEKSEVIKNLQRLRNIGPKMAEKLYSLGIKTPIAVGSKVFIEATIKRLGIKAKGRKLVGSKKSYELREPAVSYGGNFTHENGLLRLQNTYFWDDIT